MLPKRWSDLERFVKLFYEQPLRAKKLALSSKGLHAPKALREWEAFTEGRELDGWVVEGSPLELEE
jgi:hypothetical protein